MKKALVIKRLTFSSTDSDTPLHPHPVTTTTPHPATTSTTPPPPSPSPPPREIPLVPVHCTACHSPSQSPHCYDGVSNDIGLRDYDQQHE